MTSSGWVQYPLNLSHLYPYDDLDLYNQMLANNANRLFNPDRPEIRLETVVRSSDELGQPQIVTDILDNDDELEDMLAVS